MCFSATANFVGSGVLGAVGVVTLTKVKHRRELLFAALPMLFGAQRSRHSLHQHPKNSKSPRQAQSRSSGTDCAPGDSERLAKLQTQIVYFPSCSNCLAIVLSRSAFGGFDPFLIRDLQTQRNPAGAGTRLSVVVTGGYIDISAYRKRSVRARRRGSISVD